MGDIPSVSFLSMSLITYPNPPNKKSKQQVKVRDSVVRGDWGLLAIEFRVGRQVIFLGGERGGKTKIEFYYTLFVWKIKYIRYIRIKGAVQRQHPMKELYKVEVNTVYKINNIKKQIAKVLIDSKVDCLDQIIFNVQETVKGSSVLLLRKYS